MDKMPLTPDVRTLAADLFERYAHTLLRRLAWARPGTDRQQLADAVVQAVLDVSQHFERYDSERASLLTFLLAAARRVLQKSLRAQRRRLQREEEKAQQAVTTDATAGRSSLDWLGNRELAECVRAEVARTDEERRALDLWLGGETDPAALAVALGLDQAQARTILARLRQRLHRCRRRYRREESEP